MALSRRGSLFALLIVSACASHGAAPPQPLPPPPAPEKGAVTPVPPPPPSTRLNYPSAPKHGVVDLYRDTRVVDDYQWLEDGDDPAVKRWSEEENTLARSWLDALPARKDIHERIEQLVGETSPSWSEVIARRGTIFALERRPPKQHPYLIVLKTLDDATNGRTIVDPDQLDPGGHATIDFFVPSNDGKLVAVSISSGGSESGDVHVFDVATGKERPGDMVLRVNGGTAGGSVAWKNDDTGFFYTRYPRAEQTAKQDAGFHQQVYFHKIGDAPQEDAYALGHDSPRIAEWKLESSEDGRTIVASMEYGDGGQYDHWVSYAGRRWEPVALARDHVRRVEVGPDGMLYLLSFADAPRGKVLRTSASLPEITRAQLVVGEGDGVIEEMQPTKTRMYLVENVGGVGRVRSVGLPNGAGAVTIATPPISSVFDLQPLGGDDVVFASMSYTSPAAWYRARGRDGARATKTALAATSRADFSRNEVVRETCTSKDGTVVPLTVVRPRGLALNGSNPTVLSGYGGFGITMSPRFRADLLLWLEHGGVFAMANLRGGGELGEEWHHAGYLTKKQNVFDDFDACVQHLVSAKYTTRDKLAIRGGSNGGLLMGAELTQHPDSFKAVVAQVGIFDMLRVERDTNGAFNTTEYGSVSDPKQFDALFAYSPFHHVRQGTEYPAALFMTGANDPRVNPYHSRKMVAKLQSATSSDAPILLRTSAHTGHSLGTPVSAQIEELTDVYAFLSKELGVTFPADTAAAAAAAAAVASATADAGAGEAAASDGGAGDPGAVGTPAAAGDSGASVR